ncbi:MAG: J domain-containing protein [Acidimicrobiales bacterium]|nr:J domain-containing protein [Acidimicrobiales bacterium]
MRLPGAGEQHGEGTESTTPTYYEVLGVAASATHDELRDAYRTEALAQHPDRHASADARSAAEAELRMRVVNAAWQVLGDPVSRAAYDAELARAARAAEVDDGGPADPLLAWQPADGDERWPAERPTSVLVPLMPLLLLVGLLLLIAVFTAYARTG